MGFAKREMERAEGLESVATAIAIEMGALSRCEFHDELVDELAGMNEEVEEEAVSRLTNGAEEMSDFRSPGEVRDAVRGAFENAGMECGSCAKHRDD